MFDYMIITIIMHKYITSTIADFFNTYQILVLYIIVILFVKSIVEIFKTVVFFYTIIKKVMTIHYYKPYQIDILRSKITLYLIYYLTIINHQQ